MNNALLFVSLALVVHALAGCAETTVTFLTQAPPGRSAVVDVETETLTVTRGLAVAFECVEWTEAYSGPCRDMSVALGDDGVAEHAPAHLDALSGQTVSSRSRGFDDDQTLGGPADRQGGVLLARAEGTTTLTVSTAGADLVTTVVVEQPPAPPDVDGAPDDG